MSQKILAFGASNSKNSINKKFATFAAKQMVNATTDKIIISFAEHNGAYTTAFKNIMDWISRMEGSLWEDKPMLLLATSPGGRGGKSVLDLAINSFKFMSKGSLHSFSLPVFQTNFTEEQVTNHLDTHLSKTRFFKIFGFSIIL